MTEPTLLLVGLDDERDAGLRDLFAGDFVVAFPPCDVEQAARTFGERKLEKVPRTTFRPCTCGRRS